MNYSPRKFGRVPQRLSLRHLRAVPPDIGRAVSSDQAVSCASAASRVSSSWASDRAVHSAVAPGCMPWSAEQKQATSTVAVTSRPSGPAYQTSRASSSQSPGSEWRTSAVPSASGSRRPSAGADVLTDDPATLVGGLPQQIDTVADLAQALPGLRCQAHPSTADRSTSLRLGTRSMPER